MPCTTLAYSDYEIPATVPQQPERAWTDPDFTPPFYTFGTVPDDYDFQPEACDPNFYICWPTIAPTGIAYYGAGIDGVPGWGNSLLVAALKTGTIYRLPLTADGQEPAGEPIPYFQTTNRYRDVAFAPAGRTFYVITDNSGSTQDAQGLPTNELAHSGAILVFVYTE